MGIRSTYGSIPVMLALSLLLVPMATLAQETQAPHWSYSGQNDPKHWGKLDQHFASCSMGHRQSPIDIKDAKKADLPALKFDYQPVPLNIIDNGHTVMIAYAPGSTLTVGEKVYTLKQFHFHHPSEEHIKGKGFPLAVHLVHSDDQGHLAVVAVLFEDGAANALIDSLWRSIPKEKEKAVDVASVSVQAQDLLPAHRGYFTFSGSLTTPPCTEGVAWYVLQNHGTVSQDQIAAFAKIYPNDARPIQPTNGRDILESK